MFLADYHIHSTCSFDAKNRMVDMAKAAFDRGVTEVCFTDHCDFGVEETIQIGPDEFTLPRQQAHQYIETLEKAPDGMFIALGLELAQANHEPARGKRIYAMPEYDFILGSLHSLRDMRDFYYLKYTSREQCEELYEKYLEELIELAGIGCFDTMAHIGYCLRYMHQQGMDVELSMEEYGDRIDTLLRTIIENGKGIELNCADIVPGGRDDTLVVTFPSLPILRRYRELGGDIVTLGSDAHTVRTSGLGIAEGCELLRDNGFHYVTTYKKHKPEFKRI